MIDYYLRFDTEEEANTILQDVLASIDVIGSIDGTNGWHVNVRSYTPIETLDVYKIDPEPLTPIRVWA